MTWNQFRADEEAQISIWQVPPEYGTVRFTSARGWTASQRREFASSAKLEGPRLIVPWTSFTIFGDHRGAMQSRAVNDLFVGTPLTNGVRPDDGFLFVVYYPDADIAYVRFVHVNDEAAIPQPYDERLRDRFRFFLNGIPTSEQLLSDDYVTPPMSFGEEFFVRLPETESDYARMTRAVRMFQASQVTGGVSGWSSIEENPALRDTIYYRSRSGNAVNTHDAPFVNVLRTPGDNALIDPTTPWPESASPTGLRDRLVRAGAANYLSLLPGVYAKPVDFQHRDIQAVFENAATGRQQRESIPVYALDTSAGDFALSVTRANASKILKFGLAGVNIVPPSGQLPELDLTIPTFGTPTSPVEGGSSEPSFDFDDEANYDSTEDFYSDTEDSESSGLTSSLPLIVGAAAAGYFFLNR